MQYSTLCSRQYLHAPLLCRGPLCRVSHQPGKHPPYTQILGCESGQATRIVPDATTEKIRNKNKSRLNSRQAVRSNPFMSQEAQVEVNQGSKIKNWEKINKRKTTQKNSGRAAHSLLLLAPFLPFPSLSSPPSFSAFPLFVFWFASSALAAQFTSRNLLACSWLLCHDAINLSAPNRTPMYHGTPPSLRAASVQTSLSTPKVRRSVGVERCRAPNVLKESLKLFCRCCAGRPGPGSPPPSSLPANNSRFGSRLSSCLAKARANRSRRWRIVASTLWLRFS